MYNDLFSIGPLTIHGYGLMIAIGVLCAILLADRRARNRGLSVDIVYGLAFVALLFGFLGAKLLYCIVELPTMLRNPMAILSGGGFVLYGGVLGGVLAAMVYCKIKKVRFLDYLDLTAPSIALAQGFGRIGCFLAGCCYGKPTDWPIGIVFPASSLAPGGVPLIPTQLISSGGDFLFAAVLLLYARKSRPAGRVGALYLMLYSVGRFIIEFFRGDPRGDVGALSTSQFIAIFILAAGLLLYFKDRLPFPKKTPEEPKADQGPQE